MSAWWLEYQGLVGFIVGFCGASELTRLAFRIWPAHKEGEE